MDIKDAMDRMTVIQHVCPDDEIVANGYFHMERMNDNHIWFNIGGFTFDLTAIGDMLKWTNQSEWPKDSNIEGKTDHKGKEE